MKSCTKCGLEKPLLAFYHRKGKPRSECKTCTNSVNKSTVSNEAKLKAQSSYRSRNKEDLRKKHSDYKKNNRAICNASWMAYHASKLSATPKWLTLEDHKDIKAMYLLAKKFEGLCGIKYHVDHIVPLKGENVCGLHVPWNLQLLPASINISKSNKHVD